MPQRLSILRKSIVLMSTTQYQDSILIRAGRVAAIGCYNDLIGLTEGATETFDLHGATVLPGLIDTHPQPLHFAARQAPLVEGIPGSCQFSTRQQCMATASGTFASCGINPRYAHARRRGAAPR